MVFAVQTKLHTRKREKSKKCHFWCQGVNSLYPTSHTMVWLRAPLFLTPPGSLWIFYTHTHSHALWRPSWSARLIWFKRGQSRLFLIYRVFEYGRRSRGPTYAPRDETQDVNSDWLSLATSHTHTLTHTAFL